jgi:mediator of RNA polymerase II transcription subunit 31
MKSSEEYRFILDAEFAQALCNIDYVLWLGKQGYFQKKEFINYIHYLRYLSLPEYAVQLTYPRGVEMVEILSNESVQKLLIEDPLTFRRILMEQLWSLWARKTEMK